jgi:hypothetical protein
MKKISPKTYGLNSRVSLFRTNRRGIQVLINRKSRIIMKDGYKILKYIEKINKIEKEVKITIKIDAPLCSKTKQFLENNGVTLDLKH